MVGLDHCGLAAQTAFYNVWIDGSLYQEVYSADLLCFFLKYNLNFIRVNAQDRFYSKLAGVEEPERKRSQEVLLHCGGT